MRRPMLNSPRTPENYPERFQECEASLQGRVDELIAEAVSAGWNEGEASAAIAAVALRHLSSAGAHG